MASQPSTKGLTTNRLPIPRTVDDLQGPSRFTWLGNITLTETQKTDDGASKMRKIFLDDC